MRLSPLLDFVRADSGYTALRDRLAHGLAAAPPRKGHKDRVAANTVRFSVLEAAKPAILAALHRDLPVPTILLVGRLARARQLAAEMEVWVDDPRAVHLFPELDALPYERLAPGPEHLSVRLRAMLALSGFPDTSRDGATPPLIVATARAAMDRLMPPETCRAATWRLRVGDSIRPDHLIARWVEAGYEPVSVVEGPGEFARRGGIIDIFPCGATLVGSPSGERVDREAVGSHAAFRIELWGNDIDSIRVFDPASQRSVHPVDEIVIGPAHEVASKLPDGADDALESLDLSRLRPRVRDEVENEERLLREGQAFPMLEWYRGLLGTVSILDYLPEGGLLVVDEPGAVGATVREIGRQAEILLVDLLDRGEAPGQVPRPYWTWEELTRSDTPWHGAARPAGAAASGPPAHPSGQVARLDLVLDPAALDTAFVPAPSFSGRLPELIDRLAAPDRTGVGRVLVVSQQAARLHELAEPAEVAGREPSPDGPATSPDPSLALESAALDPSAPYWIVHGVLGEGWVNDTVSLTVLTDREIFGWAKVRRPARHQGVSSRERFLSELETGELVVHVDHGVGRFRGLLRIADRATGLEREYLDIEYAENARLRVPADHADRVSRYVGAGEALPSLTKLGSGEWQRTKQRIRAAVHRIARDLLELYAHREVASAVPLTSDSTWQMELEASFPYVETPDQLEASAEVKEDLESVRPMDRLLVGDVGYGKTEVALRAAFRAVTSGRQVAVLVPTTVLALQHLGTFRERLAPFPVRVEALSRFLTDRQAREVIEGLHNGRVDIVIGTHRLLQRDVVFKDLGLLVIDEEQRFGVSHKEQFKRFRTEVHVLSLSATPIPRTLHLSLVGVRDLSMIQTPPEDRLPIRTYVGEHDEGTVREAILRELDRGGQVYYVSNRVYSIQAVAARLAALVPEARIAIGHGQMTDDDLEETMVRFANGDADVLVCTTIIEAGLDLPNVNTIIVTNAHQFGLSQLYQLRGRVGRGVNRAFAYFFYPWDRPITEIAEKRLRAIFEATELGAGYRIALKDLEIRGAGNLLGTEQHGHISAVGFDLYCRLLGEAVEQLKKLRDQSLAPASLEQPLRGWESLFGGADLASVDLPMAAFLPSSYVAEEAARLSLYQRFAGLRDGPSLGELLAEMEDRFGPMPEPATNLFYILSLRLAATQAGIQEIAPVGEEIVVKFRGQRTVDPQRLSRAAGVSVQARANQVRMPLGRGSEWMPRLRDLVDCLTLTAAV